MSATEATEHNATQLASSTGYTSPSLATKVTDPRTGPYVMRRGSIHPRRRLIGAMVAASLLAGAAVAASPGIATAASPPTITRSIGVSVSGDPTASPRQGGKREGHPERELEMAGRQVGRVQQVNELLGRRDRLCVVHGYYRDDRRRGNAVQGGMQLANIPAGGITLQFPSGTRLYARIPRSDHRAYHRCLQHGLADLGIVYQVRRSDQRELRLRQVAV